MSGLTPSPSGKSPKRWSKEYDDEGNMYLFNSTTGESKWPSPVKQSRHIGGLPRGWMALEDEEGNVYYYDENSGEVTWDRPEGAGDAYGYESATGGVVSPTRVSPISAQKKLPSGWAKDIDPETQQKYYYNHETEESQWHTPKRDERTPNQKSFGSASGGKMMAAAAGAGGSSTGKKSLLEPQWERAVDPETGERYYYNHNTDESQWHTPKRSSTPKPGWETAIDPESGERYWYHPETLESQWGTPTRTPKGGKTPTKSPYASMQSIHEHQGQGGSNTTSPKRSPVPPTTKREEHAVDDHDAAEESKAERMSEEELLAFKFEKLKRGAVVLRMSEDFNDPGTVWQEWQAGGAGREGPVFYAVKGMRGGQWKVPKVFLATNKRLTMVAGSAPVLPGDAYHKAGVGSDSDGEGTCTNAAAAAATTTTTTKTAVTRDWRDEVKSEVKGQFLGNKRAAAAANGGGGRGLTVDTSGGGRDSRESLLLPGSDNWNGSSEGFATSGGAEEWMRAEQAQALVTRELDRQMRLKEQREQEQQEREHTPSKSMAKASRPHTASAAKAKARENELKESYAALQGLEAAGGGKKGAFRMAANEREIEANSNRARAARSKWEEYVGPTLAPTHDTDDGDWRKRDVGGGDDDDDDDDDSAHERDPAVAAYRESLRSNPNGRDAGYGSDDSDFGDNAGIGPAAKEILRNKVVNRVEADREAVARQERKELEKEAEEERARKEARERSRSALNDDSLREMAANAVVIQQRWPWTRLVDMRSDLVFYHNEQSDAYQHEPPATFTDANASVGLKLPAGQEDDAYEDFQDDHDEEEHELRARNRVLNAKGGGRRVPKRIATKSKFKAPPTSKKWELPSRRGGNKNLDTIRAGELSANVDSRYKEEVYSRSPVKEPRQQQVDEDGGEDIDSDGGYCATEADRFLRNDFSSLRALSAQQRERDGQQQRQQQLNHRGNAAHGRSAERTRSIFEAKDATERLDYDTKYAPPPGVDKAALRYTLDRAAQQAGHRPGMLFLISKGKFVDRRGRAAEAKFAAHNGDPHMGLHGMVHALHAEESPAEVKRQLTPDELQQEQALELLDRLRRLATETLQPGYEEKPEQAEGAPKKDNKTGGPSMSMDQDVEFLKARQSHARQFQLNEMRNKERSIAELLSIQTESMDALYPTFIENEMNRRYLLEAAVLQRGKLRMPRTARQAKATPKLSDWYKCGHLLSTQDIKDLEATHEITSASDGCWTVHRVAPDHPSQRSVTVFVNNQTKVTQMGEPLDLRCRRSRSSFREEKWSVMSRYLPKASVITRSGIKLVSDPDGGLLYYHPVYDRYASSDSFDSYVSNETIMDTIRRREGIRAEMKAADSDRYGRSLNTKDKKKQQAATTAATFTSTGGGGSGGGTASEGDYFLEHPNLIQEKLSGYRHATDASIERDVIEYPEPNIWAGILLPPNIIKPGGGGKKKNTGAITAIKGSKQPSSGGSISVTPRNNNVECGPTPTRDLNSPSAGVTPGPQDYKKQAKNNDNSGNGGSENQPENNAWGSPHAAAESFVSNLSVPAPGGGDNTMMRPFSAGSTFGSEAYATTGNNNNNMSVNGSIEAIDESRPGTAPESGGNMPVTRRSGNKGLSLLIQEQQATLANSGPAAMKKTLTALNNPYGVVDPILYEEEMDHSTYAEYRGLIHKLAEEPRNPVLLLKLSSFLYTKKMDHACMAALNRTIEVLEEWNLTSESSSMLQILRSKVGVRVYGKYADLSEMKEHALLCKDSPTILSQIAMYYNRLKYMEQAEQLYIAALLIDPLHAEANRGYAHVLIQKSNFQAANRYFVRVYSHSLCYSIVKAEQGWLQEMQGADDEAIVQAFKKCLSLGNRDRGTVCALYSLGHFFHVRKDFAKAVDFYRRSLMYDPNEFETLLLLGCLGNSLPHGEKKYNKYQIDSWMRRGLLMQQRGASRWVALLIYAENLIANFGDFDRAEMYLWQAVNDSYSKEIWAVVSLAHYYEYTLCNPQRAKRLLLWSAKSRADAAKVKVKADPHNVVHNRLYESSGVGLEESTDSGFGQGIAFRDGMNNHYAEESAFESKREGENYFRMKMHGEEAVLHVAVAYACLDVKNFAGARKHAETALSLDAELGPAHRCMGLILYRQRENRKAALKHFNECLDLCGNTALLEAGGGNEHSLRTCAIVLSMEGSYTRALHYMRAATVTVDSVHVLSWRAYAIMSYLYGEGSHKELATSVVPLLTRAIELSEDTDVESMIMKGQLLMELQQPVEARQCFQKAMSLTPNDPVLLASMALCLASIGFRSPVSVTQADYDARFQDMRSIGELSLVEDPELLFQAATNPTIEARIKEAKAKAGDGKPRDPTVLSAVRFPTVLSSSSQITEEPAEIEATVKDKKLLPPPTGEDQSSINYRKPRDVESDVLYWRGMHQMQQKGSDSMEKAKASFTRAVQRSDCPPHPLALYMLGWITELRGDLKVAERYYCYALQLEPIDSLYFLRLQKLAKDTLSYVRGLAKTAEKAEAHRKKVLKKKNKLRRKGVSVPIGFEADETGEQAVALATMRKRMLLHERVHKLAAMRQEQLGKRLHNLNTPGKCVSLDPFWQERLLHAFTECDDWASLLRSSNVYKKS